MKTHWAFSAAIAIVGCSSSQVETNPDGGGTLTDGAMRPVETGDSGPAPNLFAPLSGDSISTPNDLRGLWMRDESGIAPDTLRLKLSADSIVVSTRCNLNDTATTLTVSARVTAKSILALESKSVKSDASCGYMEILTGEMKVCESEGAANCVKFAGDGTRIVFSSEHHTSLSGIWQKLSD